MSISADRATKDRVARGNGRSVSAQDGIGFCLEGGQFGVAKEADGGTKDLGHAHAGGRVR
eukprot:jgi/Chrpa1/27181/Chrysochromulina_OHIO_Genome00027568-RA